MIPSKKRIRCPTKRKGPTLINILEGIIRILKTLDFLLVANVFIIFSSADNGQETP